jgi:hypothetical protein
MSVGDKIKFDEERQRYTVMAQDDRFAILVKPFNARKTYIYTITDLSRGERGRCNRIFGIPRDVSTAAGAQAVLAELQAGEIEVTHRRPAALSPAEIAQLRARAGAMP